MIPLCLVTGFLGSGKTSLLQDLAPRLAAGTVALVNEFSHLDVDGTRIDLPAERMVSIPGGSIFCRCKVTDFTASLASIAYRQPPPPGVVVEASGMADPAVLPRMLMDTGLADRYHLARVVGIVDPGNFTKLRHTLPALRAQIAAASVVLINKVDLHDRAAIDAVREGVRAFNPSAPIIETVRAACGLEPFAADAVPALEGDYAGCADPAYVAMSVRMRGTQQADRVGGLLADHADDLYRAKGVLDFGAGPENVDWSAGRFERRPATLALEGGAPSPGLVLIGRGESVARLNRLLAQLRN